MKQPTSETNSNGNRRIGIREQIRHADSTDDIINGLLKELASDKFSQASGGECWTLVIVLRAVRPWGFWTDNGWFPWRQYVGDDAIARKNCP